jgi:hypothetical protein
MGSRLNSDPELPLSLQKVVRLARVLLIGTALEYAHICFRMITIFFFE